MPILQRHYDEIKSEFEKDKGWLLRQHLTNKQYLIKEFLPEYPHDDSIGFEAESFNWYEFSNTSTEREDVFIVKGSFIVMGNLIFYDQLKESLRKEIMLDITAEIICTYYADSGGILYIPEDFTILTGDLKKISSFDAIVLREFNNLTMLKPLSAGIYDKTWSFNEPKNKTHEFISSLDYFYEIENMNRQAKYFIALAKTYSHYANDYFPRVEVEPFIHYQLNLTSHDRRYLDYCTSAVHSMYVYWERIALLIYQYYKPKNQKKVNDKNLSFTKLMCEIINEQQATGIDLSWFEDFLKDDHSKLQMLRHPLVHFRIDSSQHKGSYIPMIHTRWIKNIGNKAELDQIENFSKKLIEEIIDLAKKCNDGYERSIELIIDIKSASASV